MENSKATMLKAVERMEAIVNDFYGDNLQRELGQLREALLSNDEVELANCISETVDGCCSATSQIRELGYALDNFEEAQHQFQSELDAAIEAFENSI